MRLLAVNDADAATLTAWRATNLCLWSDDFTQAIWGKTATTVTADALTLANGMVADKLVETSATSAHVTQQSVTLAVGYVTFSLYVAAAERTSVVVGIFSPLGGTSAGVTADLTAGTSVGTSTQAGVIEWVASSVTLVASGTPNVYRVSITARTYNAGAHLCRLSMRDGAGTGTYTGVVGSGVYLVRAQVEQTPARTIALPTTSAAYTSSDFAASLPVTNLQKEGRALVARTAGLEGTQGVIASWSASRNLNCVVLYGHNLSTAGYVRLFAFDGPNGTGALVYDSDNANESASAWSGYTWPNVAQPRKYSVLWLPSTIAARSILLVVRDSGTVNPDGYWQAKRLLAGLYIEPARQLAKGLKLQWQDASTQQRTAAGSLRTDVQAMYRSLSGQIDALTEAERAAWMEALGYCGLQREIFVSVFPGVGGAQERDHTLLGKLTSMPDIERDKPLYMRSPLAITEV